ncbi:hypothetical protein [Flavobacterium sp. ASW18X]|uniref:hypothetical protein n=1 Tax=Flavobacterium sp. ASW18X TaxID=2572595 RepID=UPI0010AE7598|nr:hypothetical protein [Flavobacterium sp. ASW18X]TKD58969.1 hypothetical protein FBT53_14995 [Flavobacterium sp. ASW18X]
MELKTEGLHFAAFYDLIFHGEFEEVEMQAEDMVFPFLLKQYLLTAGVQCKAQLPKNKVEIMEDYCIKAEETIFANGERSTRCITWGQRGTDIFARPELYAAFTDLEYRVSQKGIQTFLTLVRDKNGIGHSVDRMHKVNGIKEDMANFFMLNACANSAIRRFEDNLRLFALGQPGIKMNTVSKFTKMKKNGGPIGEQNLTKLLDDLIIDQARTWMMNRYIAGSVSKLVQYQKDGQGRPISVRADYSFKGFGNGKGWVQVNFENGLPKCIYFYDFPENCKTPSGSIVASYAAGNYAQ